MALCRASPTESPHHQDVLPSILVEAVLTRLLFSVFLGQAREDGCSQPAAGACFLQLQLQVLLITHVLLLDHTVSIFTNWNINTQSMCPSSLPLIRCECKSISLNSVYQRFYAHLCTSQARTQNPRSLLLKTFSQKERRKAALLSIALARTSSLPIWLSFFASWLF